MRRIKNVLVGVICLTLLMPTVALASNNKPEDWGDVRIENKAKIPSAKAGKKIEFELPIINLESKLAENVIVSPIRDSDPAIYPFTTKKADEYTEYGNIEPNKTKTAKMKFTVRKDALNKDYTLKFEIKYKRVNDDGKTVNVRYIKEAFIKVKGVDPTNPPKKISDLDKLEEGEDEDDGDYSGGDGDDSGDDNYGGGSGDDEESKKSATPRVIIESFRTEPKVVNAGASFKLILEVRNTSKKTAVSNMEINLQAAGASDGDEDSMTTASDTFLPDKGSNTLYVDSIAANSTTEVSIDLTARADLQQQPYSMGIAMRYEDNKAEQYDAAAEISILVNQKARFELSQIEVSPESIEVGGEGNVVFSIYNLGRTKLYNVKVKLVDDTIADGEAFIGNLEAGATGEVDLMATGVTETTDDGTVQIQITYEDKDGNASSFEDKCTIFVMPAMEQGEMPMDEDMMIAEEAQEGLSMPVKVGIGIGAVAVVAAAAFGIIKYKRKKEEDFADEFLGSDKDERE